MADTSTEAHPWVRQRRNRVSFVVQAFPRKDDPEPMRRVVDAGVRVDELGFDGFLTGDHPAAFPDPFVALAAVATRTRHVTLGSVVIAAGYRHPVMTARLAADLDQLSNGRYVFGLGIGWDEGEFTQLGQPFTAVPQRQRALSEAVAIIRHTWAGEPFTFDGRTYLIQAVTGGPRPIQRPGPPILIAGAGDRTLRQVAELADACNFGPSARTGGVHGVDRVRERLDYLERACEAIGRDPASILKTHFMSWIMLGRTESDAEAKMRRYYPDGLTDEQRVTRLVGTPDQAVAYFQALADAGMRLFVVQTQDAADVESIELLASDVMPHVAI